MNSDLICRRRLLQLTYMRYVQADSDWAKARSEARSWFPEDSRPPRTIIGDPGSRLRRLHERRARALNQLAAARASLAEARRAIRQRRTQFLVIGLLPAP